MSDERTLSAFDPASAPDDLVVRAAIRRSGSGVALVYRVHGAGRLDIPPPRPAPGRADRLWEHTCLEAFLAPTGGTAYWELNVSPAGDWNLYRFARYREAMETETRVAATACATACAGDDLQVEFSLSGVPELARDLDVGLTAVLKARDGTLSYWALRHADARPDFHRRETFALRLPGGRT